MTAAFGENVGKRDYRRGSVRRGNGSRADKKGSEWKVK